MKRNGKRKSPSIPTVHERLSQIEASLEHIMSDLEEIKLNTSRKKRKFSLFSKGNRKKKDSEGQADYSAPQIPEKGNGKISPNGLDLNTLLRHPMMKSMLENQLDSGIMDLLKEINPSQITKMMNNPLIKSMLKNM